jgi:alpha-tubulin suppressor-like RCC1 family protein
MTAAQHGSRNSFASAVTLLIAVAAGSTTTVGCLGRGVFHCHDDQQCGGEGAFCESTGLCSTADMRCQSGRRYGNHATDELAGRCVDDACPANPVVQLRAGGSHACVVRQSNGAVDCWGAGNDGQLGNGTALSRSTPTRVGTPDVVLGKARDVALGTRHSCALLTDETVWCWGSDDAGQMGDGGGASRFAPTPVDGLIHVVAIVAGGAFTCALDGGGDVRCWGRNTDGELGTDFEPTSRPTVPLPTKAVALTARDRHACARLDDGRLFCWGSNEQGELGNGFRSSRQSPGPAMFPAGHTIAAIAAGTAHTCALADGAVWCWGSNQVGELGDGTDTSHLLPTIVPLLSSFAVKDVSAAGHHTCAEDDRGSVWCWGANQAGQLGEGTTSNIAVPVPVTGVDDAVSVATGDSFSCAVRRNGTVWCWGDDRVGQLGAGTAIERLVPFPVPSIRGALSITAGGAHTCARWSDMMNEAAATACWGDNQAGQIGDGTRLDRSTPVPLKFSLIVDDVVAGALHTCLRGTTGPTTPPGAWCWGRGGSGQLGTSTLIDVVVPANVSAIGDPQLIAAGKAHTCALLRDQSAWCWGANDDGQLGDRTTAGRSTPIAVMGAGALTQIVLGGAHTCGLRTDRTVICWGRGTEGQLGDQMMTNSSSPVVVSALTNVVEIAAGARHTCARVDDETKTVHCWGEGESGQLGWGATADRPIPSKVMNLEGAVEITAGDNHTCARTSVGGVSDTPGSVFCWGDDSSGQLGDQRPNLRAVVPVKTDGLTDAIAITAGGAHSCAIRSDHSIVCWGSDSAGQLGNGTVLQYLMPRPADMRCP